MAGQREEYKGQEAGTQWSVESEVLWRQDLAFRSEDLVEVKGLSSGWLLCFSDLQLEPLYLSPGFYYLCYILAPSNEVNGNPFVTNCLYLISFFYPRISCRLHYTYLSC